MSSQPALAPSPPAGIPWTLTGLLAGFLVIVVALAADTALLLGSIDGTLPVTPAATGVTVAVAPFAV